MAIEISKGKQTVKLYQSVNRGKAMYQLAYYAAGKRIQKKFSDKAEAKRVAFTSAEGWGSYSQKMIATSMVSTLDVKWGKLRLKSIRLAPPFQPAAVSVKLGANEVPASIARQGDQTVITLSSDVTLTAGQPLELTLK